jgi:phosphoribosylaminoimidazole synthetase
MGAYAPAPVPYETSALLATFVQPVLDHFAAAGTPYVGVLYVGLMLTADGPRLVEYNVRFGDPEAQAVLPLVRSDLAALALAATRGDVTSAPLDVADGAACTLVAAAAGYPTAPRLGDRVTGTLDVDRANALVFPAGLTDGVTSGGRVLTVTGLGADLGAARDAAYAAMAHISFDGMQVRRDIAWRAPGAALTSYAAAGVDIDEGNRAVAQLKEAVERTHGAEVIRGVGSFGGAFSAKALMGMDDPILVASTDGVGTKVELAARLGKVRGTGMDIVNHCVGDVLVQSARPLFFLDYIAASSLDAELVAEVVSGMGAACEAAGCTLLGGETAEMPGVYMPGAFDIAGTLVGVAERSQLLPRADVAAGDVLIGVASSGPHTNGYSLLRKLFAWIPMDTVPAGLDRPLGDALLEPHRNYLDVLTPALATGHVKALAHITGGGLPENVPRVLPHGVDARIELGAWPVPPLFQLVRELATGLDTHELHRTLNMGVGMVVVCAPDEAGAVQAAIPEDTWVIGALVPGTGAPTVHLV